jgi:hypothetical protein
MSKQIVLYRLNSKGEIAKFVDGVECVDGVVVDEGSGNGNGDGFFARAWAWFYSSGHDQTVGGNKWEERHKNKAYNDNGREYNPATGNWEYTSEANGDADPYQCNYKAEQDYQGSVPSWDGYSGE